MLKKKDVVLGIVILLLAGIMALAINSGRKKDGEQIRIMIDGSEYGSYSLMHDRVIEVENDYGYNKLVIQNGMVNMEQADCPDGYCVAHTPISKARETIVCLPHKLVVEVQAASDSGIDSIVQ